MYPPGALGALRFLIPQVVTTSRVILGMFAIYWAAQHQFDLAAKIIVLGFLTDVLDGTLARKLGVTSLFGVFLDFFADYLYYVVAPTCLVLFLLAENARLYAVFLMALPTVGGALRYARRAGLTHTTHPGLRGSPGLPTNVCAFYMLSLVFLWREQVLDADSLSQILTVTLPALALLMPGPRIYPWLTDYLWILVPVSVGLYAMPFLYTGYLACISLGIIVMYVLFSPLLIPQHPIRPVAQAGETPPTGSVAH